MKKRILITNVLSYIGNTFCRNIKHKNFEIVGIVPLGIDPKKYEDLKQLIDIVPLAISDSSSVKDYLGRNDYDVIFHIPDYYLHRFNSKKKLRKANVIAAIQLSEYCLKSGALLIHVSSTNVFGTSPEELPAYFKTKDVMLNKVANIMIENEVHIEKNRLKGLKSIVLRHSILYGEGCQGFAKLFTRLIKNRVLPLINERIYIQLTNILLLVDIMEQSITNLDAVGNNYNVVDYEPVTVGDLTQFTNRLLNHQKKYSEFHSLNIYVGRKIAKILYILRLCKSARFFHMLTNNWFFDTENLKRDFNSPRYNTIPAFASIVTGEKLNHRKVNEPD